MRKGEREKEWMEETDDDEYRVDCYKNFRFKKRNQYDNTEATVFGRKNPLHT